MSWFWAHSKRNQILIRFAIDIISITGLKFAEKHEKADLTGQSHFWYFWFLIFFRLFCLFFSKKNFFRVNWRVVCTTYWRLLGGYNRWIGRWKNRNICFHRAKMLHVHYIRWKKVTRKKGFRLVLFIIFHLPNIIFSFARCVTTCFNIVLLVRARSRKKRQISDRKMKMLLSTRKVVSDCPKICDRKSAFLVLKY